MEISIYQELWTLLSDNIYGVGAVLTADQNLTMTMLCTFGVLFVVGIPFALVWRIMTRLV